MANYLDYSVLPGEPIEHHEHHRLLVGLGLLVIVAIVIVLALLYKAGQQVEQTANTSPTTLVDKIAMELRKSVIEISPQQKTAIAKELSESVVKISDKQKAAIADELAKSVAE
jgi:phenylpyruvate tautomerase PptA (4-oxalocrotonate tautomerase family)